MRFLRKATVLVLAIPLAAAPMRSISQAALPCIPVPRTARVTIAAGTDLSGRDGGFTSPACRKIRESANLPSEDLGCRDRARRLSFP